MHRNIVSLTKAMFFQVADTSKLLCLTQGYCRRSIFDTYCVALLHGPHFLNLGAATTSSRVGGTGMEQWTAPPLPASLTTSASLLANTFHTLTSTMPMKPDRYDDIRPDVR